MARPSTRFVTFGLVAIVLLDEVWGYERFPTTRTVDTHVLRLRRKLEADPDWPTQILTVHAQGYRLAGL